MTTTPELTDAQHKIVDLRQRVLAGEDIPPEELAIALQTLRKAREVALMTAPKKGRKKGEEDSDDATS